MFLCPLVLGTLVPMSYVPVAGQLLDVTFWEPLGFDLSEPLCKGEKCFVVLGFSDVGSSELGVESNIATEQHR